MFRLGRPLESTMLPSNGYRPDCSGNGTLIGEIQKSLFQPSAAADLSRMKQSGILQKLPRAFQLLFSSRK
ncbi:hypothetical protein IQ22_00671 [Pseudomonas duriflava]|uniref:Uncharacterized protein n=1 Tax=Pseudomonas duriflava TaxID=459528 RepID=A0A562QL64_9PSED|nr:hypothetical protein IQ22_00671 [Pseudomonas duriflava]